MRRPDQPPQTRYGWDRGRIGGLEGTRTWVGHGVFAHNLVTISALPHNRSTGGSVYPETEIRFLTAEARHPARSPFQAEVTT